MKDQHLMAFTRRNFLKRSVSLGVLSSNFGVAASAFAAPPVRTFAYVGTYTGTPGSGSNGEGIFSFEMNSRTGELTQRKLVAKTEDPSWIAIHPTKRYLYAVNEVANFRGKNGSVSAFSIDTATGDLTLLNVVSTQGSGPAYISFDESGKYALVANYGSGSVAVLPVRDDGSVGAATDVQRDTAAVGIAVATNAPAGSFARSGHDAPHVHMVAVSPGNGFVVATDLGQDRIYSFRLNLKTGKLTPSSGAFASLPAGDGPRHFAFHPSGRWLYSIQEESSTIVAFRFDAVTGALSPEQTVSALPTDFVGSSFASEILVSPDGRFLYGANRLHDSIAVFAIDANGRLTRVDETPTLGDYPGQCRIDPSGNFLYACNTHSDSITSFRIHRHTGKLTFTGFYTGVGSPASITFL